MNINADRPLHSGGCQYTHLWDLNALTSPAEGTGGKWGKPGPPKECKSNQGNEMQGPASHWLPALLLTSEPVHEPGPPPHLTLAGPGQHTLSALDSVTPTSASWCLGHRPVCSPRNKPLWALPSIPQTQVLVKSQKALQSA